MHDINPGGSCTTTNGPLSEGLLCCTTLPEQSWRVGGDGKRNGKGQLKADETFLSKSVAVGTAPLSGPRLDLIRVGANLDAHLQVEARKIITK